MTEETVFTAIIISKSSKSGQNAGLAGNMGRLPAGKLEAVQQIDNATDHPSDKAIIALTRSA
ncbi:MAG: hypothetical protein DRP52_01725 [Planctomycetota bacterium]|nr:MAG: hypothetical protein DRP52_01725 [Planctomycetota bacterium]